MLRFLSNRDMEPELVISYNQARLPVEVLRHQPSHKPYHLQFVLTTRCAAVKIHRNYGLDQELIDLSGNFTLSGSSPMRDRTQKWDTSEN